MGVIGLEYFKIRRKGIWLMMVLFLSVELLWVAMSISLSISRNPGHAVWESILFSTASMNGLFMPILSAIIVSRICDMEHKGATWKMLSATNVGRGKLYGAKFLCAASLLAAGLLVQVAFLAALGVLKGFPGAPPAGLLASFAAGSFAATLAVAALQQWLSLGICNQAFALCAGMLGGFIGMTAGLFPAAARRIFIWSYYVDLSPVAYEFVEPTGSGSLGAGGSSGSFFTQQPLSVGLLAIALGVAGLLYFAGSLHVSRQDR